MTPLRGGFPCSLLGGQAATVIVRQDAPPAPLHYWQINKYTINNKQIQIHKYKYTRQDCHHQTILLLFHSTIGLRTFATSLWNLHFGHKMTYIRIKPRQNWKPMSMIFACHGRCLYCVVWEILWGESSKICWFCRLWLDSYRTLVRRRFGLNNFQSKMRLQFSTWAIAMHCWCRVDWQIGTTATRGNLVGQV